VGVIDTDVIFRQLGGAVIQAGKSWRGKGIVVGAQMFQGVRQAMFDVKGAIVGALGIDPAFEVIAGERETACAARRDGANAWRAGQLRCGAAVMRALMAAASLVGVANAVTRRLSVSGLPSR
jgi:hypothetical protein